MHDAIAEWAAREAGHGVGWDGWSPGGDFLSDYELQFAHRIKEGLDEFFICRNVHCAFVGRNTDWAHT
eukprot:695898-Alexandrium_andersonii.AAC.1